MAWVSERTSSFVMRGTVCVAVFGSVLGLAGVSTQAAVTFLSREELRESDSSIRREFVNRDLFTTVEQRIKDHEAMIRRLRSPIARKEEQRNLAVLYAELGERSLGFNQLPRAEEAMQKSVMLDPDNPKYLGELANLYAAAAVRQAEFKHRVSLYRNSSQLWQNAATNTNDPLQKTEFRQGAASALMGVASELSRVGLSNDARRELETAREFARDGTPLAYQIDQMLGR